MLTLETIRAKTHPCAQKHTSFNPSQLGMVLTLESVEKLILKSLKVILFSVVCFYAEKGDVNKNEMTKHQ